MKNDKNAKDIVPMVGDAYSNTAPGTLGDQHAFLLETLEKRLAGRESSNLLVLGCAGGVLPYSRVYKEDGFLGETNRDRVKKIIGKGKIILLDYVMDEDKNGLMKARRVLQENKFFEDGYFKMGEISTEGVIDPDRLPESSISFLHGNLRDHLRVAPGSVDAVDANLSIHHASVTRQALGDIYLGISGVLRKGGILHLGEGEVDMNYTEDKLVRIGSDLCRLFGETVRIMDGREASTGYTIDSAFKAGIQYTSLPAMASPAGCDALVHARVDEKGDVYFRHPEPEKASEFLKGNGYRTVSIEGDGEIKIPLIDSEMPEDAKSRIEPVRKYYEAIKSRIKRRYGAIESEDVAKTVEKIMKGIDKETSNALNGTVEYYMGEQKIHAALYDAGFTVPEVKHHEVGPFYNIVAVNTPDPFWMWD